MVRYEVRVMLNDLDTVIHMYITTYDRSIYKRPFWRFRKIYSGTNCTVLFVYCYTVYKILRLDNENNICVQRTCIMEFATSRTFSAVRNTPTSDKSKRTPSIKIGSTLFFMCITSMLWLRCAGRRLNDSFRGIQLVEWFIQDHSDGWMIHSRPFSCLNDSFRTIQLLEWFIQAPQKKLYFSNADDPYLMVRDHQ